MYEMFFLRFIGTNVNHRTRAVETVELWTDPTTVDISCPHVD